MSDEAIVVRTQWGLLMGVIAAISIFAIVFGLSYPLLSLVLERQGHSPSAIGINAAMLPLGLVVASFLIPHAARIVGTHRLAVGSALMTGALFLAYGLWPNIWAWFPLRFFMGMATSTLFVLSEMWINSLANDHNRGRVMGLFTTVLSGGFALGPFLLVQVGSQGLAPFLVGGCICVLGALVLLPLGSRLPQFPITREASVRSFMPLAPILILAVGILAFFDQAALALLPVYGLALGHSEQAAALWLAALGAGNIFFQIPLGWVADRIGRRKVMGGCALATVALCLVLPYAVDAGAIVWPVVLCLGAAGFGVYTMALTELGDRFTGELLLAGNAAFALMWGVGGLFGGPLGGGAMDVFGPHGLPAVMALAYAVLFAFVLRGGR